MNTKKDIWNEFLSTASKDESKTETNLIILGNSKQICINLLNNILECLGQPQLKKKDLDILKYTYTTVGYPNRRNTSGDYLGVINIYIVVDESNIDYLCRCLKNCSFDNTMFIIAVNFKDTAFILNTIQNWISFITKVINTICNEDEKVIEALQKNWYDRVLSISQKLTSPTTTTTSKKDIDPASVAILPRGLLDINIGVPFMVVCSNTEVMSQSKQFSESMIDFIQKNIRLLTLQYGAALAYYNTLHKSSLQSIVSHILSILFPAYYASPSANFTSHDELFIPIGSDNAFLVNDIISDPKLNSITDYNAVIAIPNTIQKRETTYKPALQSEDDFMASLISPDERSTPLPRKSRRSVIPMRSEALKQRLAIQQQNIAPNSPLSPTSTTRGGQSSSSDSATRNFFENLINEGGNTPSIVPRKSVSVRNLRRTEANMKK